MTKREALRAGKRLIAAGWPEPAELIKWQEGGWSVTVGGKRFDTLTQVTERLDDV